MTTAGIGSPRSSYIGKCAFRGSAERLFHKLSREEWLNKMIEAFPEVSPFELEDGQQRAWGNCYDVLKEAFEHLPNEYRKLKLVFEYVMPQHNPSNLNEREDVGVRADVLLLCRDTVVVLEFKDLSRPYPGCERQARKYVKRLQKWHRESSGMRKKTVMVFTKANGMNSKGYRLVRCSPDCFPEVLRALLPQPIHTMSKSELRKWLSSEWAK